MTLFGIALISHACGQGLIAYTLAHLPVLFSSVSLMLQPVMAGVYAWVLLGEPLVALQIAGAWWYWRGFIWRGGGLSQTRIIILSEVTP